MNFITHNDIIDMCIIVKQLLKVYKGLKIYIEGDWLGKSWECGLLW